MSRVLIVFQANHEPVEQLALAVAVGAVEAEALIRLRRLAAPDAPEVGHKSYGTIAASDLAWADSIVVGLEDAIPDERVLGPLLDLLAPNQSPERKCAFVFNAEGGGSPTVAQKLVGESFELAGIVLATADDIASNDVLLRMKQLGRAAAAPAGQPRD